MKPTVSAIAPPNLRDAPKVCYLRGIGNLLSRAILRHPRATLAPLVIL